MNELNLFSSSMFGSRYSHSEDIIQMPNEIFYKLQSADFNSGKHMLFAFIYYYNITWIYRYCKINDLLITGDSYANSLKNMSGVSSMTKTFDYIIKRNGVLDKIGITKTVEFSHVPVLYHHEKSKNIVEFSYNGDYELKTCTKNNINIKEPLLHTHNRVIRNTEYLGAFHDYDFTFSIKMSDYIYMKDVLKLSFDVIGFYYYLISIAYYHHGRIDLSRESMARHLNLSEKTITKYKTILKNHGLINEFEHDSYKTKQNNTLRIRKVEKKYDGASSTI